MADVCISAFANRHALSFVYYRTAKKSAMWLNERCISALQSEQRQRSAHMHVKHSRKNFSCMQYLTNFFRCLINIYEIRTSYCCLVARFSRGESKYYAQTHVILHSLCMRA